MEPADRLYRPASAALLRASATAVADLPQRWPDLHNADDCRTWLATVWPHTDQAISLASSPLAARIGQLLAGREIPERQVRSITGTVVRYLVRSAGRPTPFGLFAGVAPVTLGPDTAVAFGAAHRPRVRADAAWLAEVITAWETGPLLMNLTVVFNTLAVKRAGRLVVKRSSDRAEIRINGPVTAIRDAATRPVAMAELAATLAKKYPQVDTERIQALLCALVTEGFLITSLRAPMTDPDPMGHLLRVLRLANADSDRGLAELEEIHTAISALNTDTESPGNTASCQALVARMERDRPQKRSALAVDLALDVRAVLPASIAADAAEAADVLARIGRSPLGPAVWQDYHRRFVERYGTDTTVPLTRVLDPACGLGYPAGYPGSVLPAPVDAVTGRDRHFLALAVQALVEQRPLELTDAVIEQLTADGPFDLRFIQPHVEIAARVRARTAADVDAGQYELLVSPARSAGTLTARFAHLTGDTAMTQVHRSVPAMHEGGHPVQLSCPPLFVRGENVARLPAFLPEVLAVGEAPYPPDAGYRVLLPEDLALVATGRGLLLLETGTGRIVDPQVFHALALEQQMPPLARFLAHVPRAFAAAFTHVDFGPTAADLPHLPEVRRGRIVLAAERWHLKAADLPGADTGPQTWRSALDAWRTRHGCPDLIEWADGDMALRLDLTVGAHAAILREHLADNGSLALVRAAPVEDFGWIGHAHEVVIPLFRTGPGAPTKLGAVIADRNNDRVHRPAAASSAWLTARVHTDPRTMDHLIAEHLPVLQAAAGGVPVWVVRYRNPEQTDHLRIRLAATGDTRGGLAAAVGDWAEALTEAGLAGTVGLDTYIPEVGRYGTGAAMSAAEDVFCADTAAVIAMLRSPMPGIPSKALTALSMLDIAEAFLRGPQAAADYLTSRDIPSQHHHGHDLATATCRLARLGPPVALTALSGPVADTWRERAAALAAYRDRLPAGFAPGAVLTSLLHLHYNRLRGINRNREAAAVRLARSAAHARRTSAGPA